MKLSEAKESAEDIVRGKAREMSWSKLQPFSLC